MLGGQGMTNAHEPLALVTSRAPSDFHVQPKFLMLEGKASPGSRWVWKTHSPTGWSSDLGPVGYSAAAQPQ